MTPVEVKCILTHCRAQRKSESSSHTLLPTKPLQRAPLQPLRGIYPGFSIFRTGGRGLLTWNFLFWGLLDNTCLFSSEPGSSWASSTARTDNMPGVGPDSLDYQLIAFLCVLKTATWDRARPLPALAAGHVMLLTRTECFHR